MNMKRILIVDDDSSVGTMLKFVIAREQLGEVVATVTDEIGRASCRERV